MIFQSLANSGHPTVHGQRQASAYSRKGCTWVRIKMDQNGRNQMISKVTNKISVKKNLNKNMNSKNANLNVS